MSLQCYTSFSPGRSEESFLDEFGDYIKSDLEDVYPHEDRIYIFFL